MNKNELTEKLAKRTGMSLKDAGEVVDLMLSEDPEKGIIAGELDRDKTDTLPGYGVLGTIAGRAEEKSLLALNKTLIKEIEKDFLDLHNRVRKLNMNLEKQI